MPRLRQTILGSPNQEPSTGLNSPFLSPISQQGSDLMSRKWTSRNFQVFAIILEVGVSIARMRRLRRVISGPPKLSLCYEDWAAKTIRGEWTDEFAVLGHFRAPFCIETAIFRGSKTDGQRSFQLLRKLGEICNYLVAGVGKFRRACLFLKLRCCRRIGVSSFEVFENLKNRISVSNLGRENRSMCRGDGNKDARFSVQFC